MMCGGGGEGVPGCSVSNMVFCQAHWVCVLQAEVLWVRNWCGVPSVWLSCALWWQLAGVADWGPLNVEGVVGKQVAGVGSGGG